MEIPITWTPDGTQWARLKPTGTDMVRTAWDNQVGCHGQYLRFGSVQKWSPPYTWTGRIRPIETMIPPIFDSPRPDNSGNITDICWYEPAIVFHPLYGCDDVVGDSHNIVLRIGRQSDFTALGLSAEMRDERPEKPYGVRTGYVSRNLQRLPASPWDGQWHDFKIEVLSHAHYKLWWDGLLIFDVVEKEPATMYGVNGLGLRLDFCDVEFANMRVEVEGEAPVTTPFDHSRYEWYPDGLCGPELVCTSSGFPRPALPVPLNEFVVHYGGAGSNWTDYGDTIQELVGIEQYARHANKPNEYNSVSDSAGETWEYAGPFRSAGNGIYNMSTWSHLALYGLENLTETEAQGLIAGIRKARQQAVDAGYLTPDHLVRPHNYYKATGCPGPLWTNKRWWDQIAAPLVAPPKPDPEPPIPTGEVSMIILDYLPGTPQWCAMVLSDKDLTHLINGHHVTVLERGGVPRVTVSQTELEGVLLSVNTVVDGDHKNPFRSDSPSANARLEQLWNNAAN